MIQDFEKMIPTIDKQLYGNLLSIAQPRLINSEVENQQVLSQVEKLMAIADRTPEQDELLALLVFLIEKFEKEYYPIDTASPHEVLFIRKLGLRPRTSGRLYTLYLTQ